MRPMAIRLLFGAMVLVAALAGRGAQAQTLAFDFTFSGNGATVTGTISGLVDHSNNGPGDVTLTSVTGIPSFNANDLNVVFTQIFPNFSVQNGVLDPTSQYSGSLPDGTVLHIDYPNNANTLVLPNTSVYGNTNGQAGVTFSPHTTSTDIPEPASLTLIGAAIAGLAAAKRRRA